MNIAIGIALMVVGFTLLYAGAKNISPLDEFRKAVSR